MSSLSDKQFLGRRVTLATCDGRHIVGVMAGMDQLMNIVLRDATEMLYSADEAPEAIPCGAYVVRGDDVLFVGLVDTLAEAEANIDEVRFTPLPSI
jgi:U6 snRNA-associated Sm-like protein LSm8